MSDFEVKRLGLMMEAEAGNPQEVAGVLNPAAARGPDGKLYMFPRLVAEGYYSRIGIALGLFNDNGDPCRVERLGIALEPEADYELQGIGRGSCEDARITYIERFNRCVMTYTAFRCTNPRVRSASSFKDLNRNTTIWSRYERQSNLSEFSLPVIWLRSVMNSPTVVII